MKKEINLAVLECRIKQIQEIFLGLNRQYLMIYLVLGEGVDKETQIQFSNLLVKYWSH